MVSKVKAYIRLFNNQERVTNINTHAHSIYKSLFAQGFSDIEKAKALDIVNKEFESYLAEKRAVKENDFLDAEKAHDYAKMNLI